MTLQRQIRVTSGPVVIDYGAIAIDVPKTLDADPPESKVTFTNLSRSTEERFETFSPIRVEVGQDRLQTIFNGQILRLEKKINKPDTTFTLHLSHHIVDKEILINESFFDATLLSILQRLIQALGLPAGDLSAVPHERVASWSFPGPVVLAMYALLDPYNLTWYIDEGRVHIASTVMSSSILSKLLINGDTGMVGSPETTDTGITVKVLLDTPVALNQLVEVESSSYVYGFEEGQALRNTRDRRTYKVFGMHYNGDNWSGSFTNTLRLETLMPPDPVGQAHLGRQGAFGTG